MNLQFVLFSFVYQICSKILNLNVKVVLHFELWEQLHLGFDFQCALICALDRHHMLRRGWSLRQLWLIRGERTLLQWEEDQRSTKWLRAAQSLGYSKDYRGQSPLFHAGAFKATEEYVCWKTCTTIGLFIAKLGQLNCFGAKWIQTWISSSIQLDIKRKKL